MRLIATALLCALVALPAPAQSVRAVPAATQPTTAARGDLPIRHVTDRLLAAPEGREAVQRYQAARAAVERTTHTLDATAPMAIGTTQTFKVRDLGASAFEQDDITFTLSDESDRFRLWVETAERDNGNVRDADIAALMAALADATPERSVNPDAGIIANNEVVFGTPPDVNTDGKSDVLWLDVRDGRSEGEGFIAGFVDPVDLGTRGNRRDILYLDTQPGLVRDNGTRKPIDDIAATAAHEYQHLIALNYSQDDGRDLTFVDEGLSEWAEVLNGYDGRAMGYLGASSDYNVPLYQWSSDNARVLLDYQRAGLFTSYLAEQLGTDRTGSLTREFETGTEGYDAVLGQVGLDFDAVLLDFHTANLLNDRAVGATLGYTTEQRLGIRALPTEVADGRSTGSTAFTEVNLRRGGVRYLRWTSVRDFSFTVDITDPTAFDFSGRRSRLRGRAILEQDGIITTQDFPINEVPKSFSGSYDAITLLIAHVRPESADVGFTYEASWTEDVTVAVEAVQYDDGNPSESNPYVLVDGTGVGYATRFEVPENGRLSTVQIPPYFLSQFSGDDASAPRDFNLRIWAADASGEPGEELYTEYVVDTRIYQNVFTSDPVRFVEVDLTEALADTPLPESIYVGATNDADDTNWLVYVTTDYAAESLTYIGGDFSSWRPLWDLELSTDPPTSLDDRIVPIRATFLVRTPVANEAPSEVPTRVTLDGAYPNPFNPSTTIRFTLPDAMPVRLAVYDLLGREQAVLLEGLHAAGTHTATVDASTWSSGLYLYRLTTPAGLETGTMTLTK